jgi:hypothetical protein
MEYVAAAERSVKCKAQSPIDNFEKLVEAACLDHAYPIKHKLKNCDMVRNFMTSRSLTRGKEPEEDQGRKGMTPPPPNQKSHLFSFPKVWRSAVITCQGPLKFSRLQRSVGLANTDKKVNKRRSCLDFVKHSFIWVP